MNLEKLIYELLKTEPFFAHFLLGAKISFDVKDVDTAGVRVVRDHIEFCFNTGFFFSKPLSEQVSILKHEVLHALLEHCTFRSGVDDKMAKNIAMDCAINQYLPELKDGVTLAQVCELTSKQLASMECYEYYYEAIKNWSDKNKEKLDKNHDFMVGDGSGEGMSEESREIHKALIKNAIHKALAASAGNVPESLQSLIASWNAPTQLPWKQILRNFVANARNIETKSTRMKPHRRFELDQPGRKKLKKLTLGVCVDESGSVSDESFAKFMKEIQSLAKSTTVTYVVHADSEVHQVDVIKNGKAKAEVLGVRHARGGTMYGPAINECVKRKCDVILYLGDGDCADVPANPKIPFLWVLVGESLAPASFGRTLRLK